jgi:competence protein ComEC
VRARRALIAAAAASIAWPLLPGERGRLDEGPSFSITVLDVGQGSSALLESPEGRRILIDAGGFAGSTFDVGERVVSRALLTMGIRRLDAVVVSHADVDHAGGLPAVLKTFPGSELWIAPGARGAARVRSIVSLALERGRALRLLVPGGRFRFGDLDVEPLHPPPGWRASGSNDHSLVLRVAAGGDALVLPGDIGRAAEARLAPSIGPARALLVPHHGSRTSSTPSFLSALRSEWALISCGRRNRYGHPAPDVAARLKASGAEVLRTDLLGALRLRMGLRDGRILAGRWRDGRWAPLLASVRKAAGRDPARSRPRGGTAR